MITDKTQSWGKDRISKILLKLAPPVMLAQLIQALYNIVDSLFIGQYSESGLTALSIVYPIQLLMIAFAVGTGVGINTIVAAKFGQGEKDKADAYAGMAAPLALLLWLLFARNDLWGTIIKNWRNRSNFFTENKNVLLEHKPKTIEKNQ